MITVTNNGVQQINAAILALGRDSDNKVLLLNQKIKEANDAIASINKILDGLNKDANVISVNGKTGIVTLDASDVGALPDSTVIPDAQVNSDWNATSGVAEILNKPNLASVATSGSYNDLSDKPTIPDAQVNSDWNATRGVAQILNKPSLATVATSGNYNDLSNKPTIPTATSQLSNDSDFATNATVLSDIASALSGGQTYGINITGNASTADTFKAVYVSRITPAQASAMVEGNRSWPLSYNKNYIQSVAVTWDSYQQHNFPAGAAGYFFPGYDSNGGTLVLVNYPSNRMLYNVWIDSNRWSGWHYVDLAPVTYS